MITIPYPQIIQKIKENSELNEEQIEQKIQAKKNALAGLVSNEGAAHIVANELGIKLFSVPTGRVKINNIMLGMRNVEVLGKVLRKYDVREFVSGERHGKVGSFVLGDETGNIRVTLWNDQADLMEKFSENDTLKIVNGLIRENNGSPEIHINERSQIAINPEGAAVQARSAVIVRKKISEITESDWEIEVLATIVQVFDPTFYATCPSCRKKVNEEDSKFVCAAHGAVEPEYAYVLNLFVDDSTDNMRVVCFREQALKALQISHEQMLSYRTNTGAMEEKKTDLLGTVVLFRGRIKKNEMFNRLELICQDLNLSPPEAKSYEQITPE